MKIVFFAVPKDEQLFFTESLKDLEVVFFDEKLEESNVEKAKDADILSVFRDCTVNKNIIDAMPNLKFIAARSTGFDNIDCEYAKTKGIIVSNVPAYGSHTVAEFAFGLLLNLSRKIITANNHVKESLDFKYNADAEGFDLSGKTLGVVGTGKIGKNVIKIAQGFGMNVFAFDLYPDLKFAEDNNVTYKTFEELLSVSDIITLHVPYTKENHHLINKEKVEMMKKGVRIINTARGELIDTEALIFGLKEGIIAGAGLDVLESENDFKEKNNSETMKLNQELMKMRNVIVTPHMAFFTREAIESIKKTTLENIQAFISGAPVNVVG